MSFQRDATTLADATNFKSLLLGRLFGVSALAAGVASGQPINFLNVLPHGSNIVGVGYGSKATEGAAVEGTIAVRVYVRAKLPKSEIPLGEVVPTNVGGLPTDVITVGDVTAFPRVRPSPGGESIGHKLITAGTLGCWVRKTGTTAPTYILSNNHVLANSNAASILDEILQPGPADGGTLPGDLIARLTDFQMITFVPPGSPPSTTPNLVDAAIAEVDNPADVNPAILGIGRVANPIMSASLYQSVRKRGRTTLHTVGVITDLSASIRVHFGTRVADFDDQLAIIGAGGVFSAGGDSGSLIVDAVSCRPVGLLFAGGGTTTFANPIDVVLSRFNIEIL